MAGLPAIMVQPPEARQVAASSAQPIYAHLCPSGSSLLAERGLRELGLRDNVPDLHAGVLVGELE